MGKDAMILPVIRKRDPDITSHRVCKSFLVGTCPHDLFVNTKQDLGRCPHLHLEKHKIEYESRVKKGETFPDFVRQHYSNLQHFVAEMDRTLQVAQRRLERTPEEQEKILAASRELDAMDTRIALMSQEIDCLTLAGELVPALHELLKLADFCCQREKLAEHVRQIAENVGQSAQQKLQVCEGCGAYLSRLDNDRRLADHFVGKIHLGYVNIRRQYDELNAKYKRLSHI